MKNLVKLITFFIVVLLIQSCKTSSAVTDDSNKEKCFYIIFQNRSGLLDDVLNRCAGLQIIRIDVVNEVVDDNCFLAVSAITQQIPKIVKIVFRPASDSNLNMIRYRIACIPQVKVVNIY